MAFIGLPGEQDADGMGAEPDAVYRAELEPELYQAVAAVTQPATPDSRR